MRLVPIIQELIRLVLTVMIIMDLVLIRTILTLILPVRATTLTNNIRVLAIHISIQVPINIQVPPTRATVIRWILISNKIFMAVHEPQALFEVRVWPQTRRNSASAAISRRCRRDRRATMMLRTLRRRCRMEVRVILVILIIKGMRRQVKHQRPILIVILVRRSTRLLGTVVTR
jgi:hypothetical protein